MPAKPRSETFDPDTVGVYHCYNQLVQKRFLFGFDSFTRKDYSYRKEWVRDRFKQLAGAMAIDVLDYAVLDNHLHVVLRNRPDLVSQWSDEEVARRWWFVCPDRKNDDGSVPEPKPCEINLNLQKVDEYRSRLSDISWMMRLACQPIGRRANKEDDMKGRFFAQRFGCKRLETWADVLACSLYNDLNVVRAGLAPTPEKSEFTSAFDRIRGRWQRAQKELGTAADLPMEEEADAWLAPIFLDERAEAYTSPTSTNTPIDTAASSASASDEPVLSAQGSNPCGAARISNKGFLPMTRDEYLSLLDVVGRMVREGKRGAIPSDLAPILERLEFDLPNWLDSFLAPFQSNAASSGGVMTAPFG